MTASNRKQARRKNSLIMSLLMPKGMIEAIDNAVLEQNSNTRQAPLNRSEWIRRAIERDLDHRERGRKSKRPPAPSAIPVDFGIEPPFDAYKGPPGPLIKIATVPMK